MTRIDFHSGVSDRISYTCRLIRKAYSAGSRIVVVARDETLPMLDDTLWTFSEHDFLPHVRLDDPLANKTPIVLTVDTSDPLPYYEVLINLSGDIPQQFASFERMIEVIALDEADRHAGRERYRTYQQRGYPLTHFTVDNP